MKVNRGLGAICINAVLGNGKESSNLHWVSSNTVSGIFEFMNPGFVAKWHPKLRNNPEAVAALPTIRSRTFANVTSELKVSRIDLWILDVEGAEEEILSGVDFKAVTINVIIMEGEGGSVKDQRKIKILTDNGFDCYHRAADIICSNQSFKPFNKSFMTL